MCDVFISCPPLRLDEVKPIVCTRLNSRGKNQALTKWRNPEEAFFWDPVFAKMNLRTGTSVISSPTSPRPLSPFFMENRDPKEDFVPECPYFATGQNREAFDSPEKTLKLLLAESERIKELVNEAEVKSRQILGTSQQQNLVNGDRVDSSKLNVLTLQDGRMDLDETTNLTKVPSYVDLYDEELIETNKSCYLQ